MVRIVSSVTLVFGLGLAATAAGAGPGPQTGLHLQGTPTGLEVPLRVRTPRADVGRPLDGIDPVLAARLRRFPKRRFRAWIEGLDRSRLREAGILVGSEIGTFLVVDVDRAELTEIARLGGRAHAPPRLRPALDVARVEVGADRAERGDGFERRLVGEGALIGIYDSGVDLTHPDLSPDRVVAVWDQDDPTGPAPPETTGGTLCDEARIRRGTCPAGDPTGHGTHALAVAASSGDRYRGIAPGARLVVARSDTFDHPLEALAWLDRVAAEQSLPMVVNLSLTTQTGPHDGTSPLARAIDELGHLVAIAAGNDGASTLHAGFGPGSGRLLLRFPDAVGSRAAAVELWSDAPLEARVALLNESGELRGSTSTIGAGDLGRTERLGTSGAIVDLDAAPSPSPENGRYVVRVALRGVTDGRDPPEGPGFWMIEAGSSGPVDAWVEPGEGEPGLPYFAATGLVPGPNWVLGDTEHTLNDLATSRASLAVSAWTNRVEVDGRRLGRTEELNRIAPTSGRGPTLAPDRTGPKPDLAAPGGWMVAARASGTAGGGGIALSSGAYAAGRGTSIAAPVAAGVAALLLGARPKLDPEGLKAFLLAGARTPVIEPDDARWGAGRIDAAEALGRVGATTPGCGCRVPAESTDAEASLWALGLAGLAAGRRRGGLRPLPRPC